MKRLIPAIAIVVIVVGTGIWLFFNLRAKQNYAHLRDEVAQNSFSVKVMDDGIKALREKARAGWEEVYSEVGGPHSNGLDAIGLRPCVANMVEVCAYQLPDYSFVSPNRNERATLLGIFQVSSFPLQRTSHFTSRMTATMPSCDAGRVAYSCSQTSTEASASPCTA